ncbi:carbohydrate ABC transporter permease [Ruania alba]|uniref:Multiple sugar transport system permease protein n=1 Tax=Ruania alba TaxID=648782 RepID=A0A1H5KS28_9MICO|nr:carbohydrate ABC transporter permease [Ruania alba]SEE67646.1 multiple sugar transport system permease protein [Ruania alba]
MARARRMRYSGGDAAFMVTTYILLAVFTLSVLYPLIFVLSASVSSADALTRGDVWFWPVGINVDAYAEVLGSPRLVRGFLNSVLYTVLGSAIGTFLTLLAGYVLSRDDLPFRRSLMFFFLIPFLFSAGIIPTYMIVNALGLMDSIWAVVLPGVLNVFNMIITMTFYRMNIPKEMLEAAQVDGATDFRFFFRMALPLSKPIIAVNVLFYAITQWNGWFNALLYLSDDTLFPLQLVLRDILTQSQVDPSMIGGDVSELIRRKELFDKLKYALIVVAMIPPMIAYPFVQKHFTKGALIGSLK